MNLDNIKNLVKQNGDKFVFVENGEPEVVMMSFDEYQKLVRSDTNIRMHSNDTNRPYGGFDADMALGQYPETEIVLSQGEGPAGLPVRLEDIRLEDLPI